MSIIRNILNSTKALVNNSLPTTGSNTFVGTQTYSGSIIPAINNTYDLGSETKQFRHLYLSSGSLYIDGQKVLGSTGNELQITTDNGQSIKILEAGSDNIILQSADGNIELKTSGGGDVILDPTSGVIGVKGTMTIYSGNKILSSDGNTIQFGNDLGITGSITTTGNVNGINLTTLSSSVDSRILTEKGRVDAILSAADADKDSFTEIVTLINSVDTTNDTSFASFYTASVGRLNNLETTSGSVNTSVSNINTFSGSALTRLSTLEVETVNLESFTSSIDTTIKTRLNAETVISGSSQVIGILSSLNTYTGSNDTTNTTQNSRLTTIESATGSYETIGRGIVSGSSQITFSGISSLPTLVSGSSQVTLSSTTGYGSVLNQALLTTSDVVHNNITASGNIVTGANITTTGSDLGLAIKYGNGSSDYGRIRFFTNNTNANTIHSFSTTWGSSFTASSRGAINIDGGTGITIGAWDSPDMYVTRTSGNTYIKGTLTVGSTITENSSLRYKENVETIKYGLDKVLQMRGVTYDKKNTGVKEIGVIAEEIYEVLPEVVLKNEEGEIDSVSYGRITAVLIEAIKDLKKEIEDLKANR